MVVIVREVSPKNCPQKKIPLQEFNTNFAQHHCEKEPSTKRYWWPNLGFFALPIAAIGIVDTPQHQVAPYQAGQPVSETF